MTRQAAETGADADPAGAPTDYLLAFRRLASGLDDDERQLLTLLAEGRTLPDIAQVFDISYSAAGARVSRLKQKLQQTAQSFRPQR
jgi:DNA-directed RNA polymerase specialized sigma24 family protein